MNTITCPRCGLSGIHACPGRPLPPPTPEDEARIDAALNRIFSERQPVKWKCHDPKTDHWAYFSKKRCKYCQPVYAGDADADHPVVR